MTPANAATTVGMTGLNKHGTRLLRSNCSRLGCKIAKLDLTHMPAESWPVEKDEKPTEPSEK